MAVIYLEPRDLAPTEAARVLDFLNAAESAQDIAARVEIPGEPDIGIRLAQRLLDARRALGRFTSVAQVRAVPLIGPERFTELCTAILGWTLGLTTTDGSRVAVPDRAPLTAELAALERRLSQLEAVRAPARIEVAVSPESAFLGQVVDITLRATSGEGAPLAGRAITLTTSQGTLQHLSGFRLRRGAALGLESGTDGSVRVQLVPATDEPLTREQQAALGAGLAPLDPKATSPHLLERELTTLAELYRSEREYSLRRALDILSRQYRPSVDTLNASNASYEWPLSVATLRADLHANATSAQSVAHAVRRVTWKNWVGAWLERLGELLGGKAGLDARFRDVARRDSRGFHLVDALIGEAHGFVAEQRGTAAEWIAQRLVKESVTRFLGADLAELDDATQAELFSNLEASSAQLTTTGRGMTAAVAQARAEIDQKVLDPSAVADLAALELQQQEFTAGLDSVRGQLLALQTGLQTISSDVSGVTLDVTRVVQTFQKFEGDLSLVRDDLESLRKGG
jgi:hypothetical protein